MEQIHKSHRGELMLQEQRHTPRELSDAIPRYISRDMPQQHADFFVDLPYFPIATLDRQGRPWVSLLVTRSESDPTVGIDMSGPNRMSVVAETNPYDPFARALGTEGVHFAGVGIDFSNRRRNKIAGVIRTSNFDGAGRVTLELMSDQHLGNCPKYITVRTLEHESRTPELVHDGFEAGISVLPDDAKGVVDRASTVFLATRHLTDETLGTQSDMGVNHRGGAPGFVRLYEDWDGEQTATYLVLPDHSGNRFYQSLGNIETDPQVGLAFPDFETGQILYVTGIADNLLGEEADALMPRVSLLTRIKVTGAVFVNEGLNLRMVSQEQLSPYNPPLKLLRQEREQMGHVIAAPESASPLTATLLSKKQLSSSISTFEFALSEPIDPPAPGGFGVFDFSGLMDAGYSHMNEANPQLVNEDYLRTWTLSSAPSLDAKSRTFQAIDRVSVTVKRKPGGLMSNVLHDNADKLISQKMPVRFKGAGAGFSCFSDGVEGGVPMMPSRMLWIAGGVGITPFMAMWSGLRQVVDACPGDVSTDIVLLFSGRDDEIAVLQHFAAQNGAPTDDVRLHIGAFQSVGEEARVGISARDTLRAAFAGRRLTLETRRIRKDDLRSVPDLGLRDVFMCGPDGLMRWADATLGDMGVPEARRHRESFVF